MIPAPTPSQLRSSERVHQGQLKTGCCRSDLAVECRRMPKPAAQGSLGQSAALITYLPFVPNFVDEW